MIYEVAYDGKNGKEYREFETFKTKKQAFNFAEKIKSWSDCIIVDEYDNDEDRNLLNYWTVKNDRKG